MTRVHIIDGSIEMTFLSFIKFNSSTASACPKLASAKNRAIQMDTNEQHSHRNWFLHISSELIKKKRSFMIHNGYFRCKLAMRKKIIALTQMCVIDAICTLNHNSNYQEELILSVDRQLAMNRHKTPSLVTVAKLYWLTVIRWWIYSATLPHNGNRKDTHTPRTQHKMSIIAVMMMWFAGTIHHPFTITINYMHWIFP